MAGDVAIVALALSLSICFVLITLRELFPQWWQARSEIAKLKSESWARIRAYEIEAAERRQKQLIDQPMRSLESLGPEDIEPGLR